MGLPKINEQFNFKDIKLPSGKSIGIKGWKVKEEKELLFASEKINEDNREEKIKIILSFLKKCVNDQKKFDTLSENDIKKISIETRKLSKGDEIEYTQRCQKESCDFILEDKMDLNTAEFLTEFNNEPLKVKEDLIIAFKEISLLELIQIQKKYNDSYNKLIYYYLINSIEAITYQGTVYTEFTEKDLVEFVDEFEPNDLEFIINEFEKRVSKISLKKTLKCLKCGSNIEVKVEDILSFLVF